MKFCYFAWVRETIGREEEELQLPEKVRNVDDVINWLSRRDDTYARAFADRTMIRAALDQEYVGFDQPLEDAKEIAFFPPMTGG